jgi:thiol-disulfide isomerase/thioredoxin
MKKSNLVTLVVLGLLLLICGAATFFYVYQKEHAVLDETVAVFANDPTTGSYLDLLGNEVSLNQYLGKILVVVSWASWSPFSQADLLMLKELSVNYHEEKVIFMAINRKETKEQATRYLNSIPALDGLVIILDPRDHFYSAIAGYAMPEAVIYNKRGEVAEHYRGNAPKAEIENTLNNLLKSE